MSNLIKIVRTILAYEAFTLPLSYKDNSLIVINYYIIHIPCYRILNAYIIILHFLYFLFHINIIYLLHFFFKYFCNLSLFTCFKFYLKFIFFKYVISKNVRYSYKSSSEICYNMKLSCQ